MLTLERFNNKIRPFGLAAEMRNDFVYLLQGVNDFNVDLKGV